MRSQERSYISPRDVRSLRDFAPTEYKSLHKLGIALDHRDGEKNLKAMINWAMDAIEPTVTTGSIPVPIQFLQNWLPGFVYVITAARKIDDLVGIMTSGSWEDEEVVQGVLELTGKAKPYGDYQNVPFSSWNPNWERRTIVRFEEGMQIGMLEEARASRARIDTASSKREAAALALEIERNKVGFFGYNNGNNRTYGILNDPGLPNYTSVPNGASGSPLWSSKTFLEIQKDILTAISTLRNQSQDQIDPQEVDITLAIATAAVDYLAKPSDFGISVRQWLREAYPRIRVTSAPEFNSANGGANVFYLYAESVKDLSTDDGRTFIQVIPAKFQVLGVQQLAKGYLEDYTNATAGVMCKRPYAVVRRSGI